MTPSTGALPEAPYSLELLADLHADALPTDVSKHLWPIVRRDPAAMAVIEALDELSLQLRDIGEDHDGALALPPEVVEKVEKTIADSAAAGQGIDNTVVPFRRRRHRIVLGIAAAAAILAVASVAIALSTTGSQPDAPIVAADPPIVIGSGGLDSGVAFTVIGKRDPGPLANPADLAACLGANSVDPTTTPLGSGPIEVDGRTGTLLILPGETPAQFLALAVGTDCGTGNPDLLARRDIG